MKLQFAVQGQSEVTKFIKDVPERVATQALLKMSQLVYDKAQAKADVHTKTGALASSVYNEGSPGNPFQREVGFDSRIAPYAIFVHWGTKPHKIRPRNRKFLRFVGSGGGFVFAKEVNHPGYAGDPFLVNAMNEAVAQFDQIISQINGDL